LGVVDSIWRYPVKSMVGEELKVADITQRGLLGDRAYALVDSSDGKVATAKNPRKWPNLFEFRAAFVEPPRINGKSSPVRITFPEGTVATNQPSDLNQILSNALKRQVTLNATEAGHGGPAKAEE